MPRFFIEHKSGELMFVGVADHSRDAGQGRDFLWSPLRITSRNNNLRQRILPLHAAYGGARILVGRIRHGAGV